MNNLKKHMILFRTLQEMPNTFTSFEFTKAAYKNGHPDVNNNGFGDFLKNYVKNQGKQSKTWQKPNGQGSRILVERTEKTLFDQKEEDKQKNNSFTVEVEVQNLTEMEIEKAIKLLKSKGYKILKPVQNYEEI